MNQSMSKSEPNRSLAAKSPGGSLRGQEIILIFMVILSLAGIVITNFSPDDAFMYWLAMIFIFGLLAMAAGWSQAKEKGAVRGYLLKELLVIQSLHWFGSLATVFCVFAFMQSGRIDSETTGLMVLLILAMATFLDGIRIGWRYSLAGIYLGTTAVVANYVQEFLLILIVLAIVVIAFSIYWEKRR
jgi:hypothetical protein